jgi:hypothetical protein
MATGSEIVSVDDRTGIADREMLPAAVDGARPSAPTAIRSRGVPVAGTIWSAGSMHARMSAYESQTH